MSESETRKTFATTVLGDTVLRLHGLRGREALSEPFQFSVTLLSDQKDPIDQTKLLGTLVKVTLDQEYTADDSIPEHPPRYFNGYVTQSRLEGTFGGYRLYRVELRPWLSLLGNTRDCRIFQNESVPEIVRKVFKERGFGGQCKLQLGTYPKREYCVQYRESDLAFVSRLLEHEGIYYYFEFEADKHTLVLTDRSTPHQPKDTYETIEWGSAFASETRNETLGGRIVAWHPKRELRAENYVLMDYDFVKPTVHLEGRHNGKDISQGTFEKFDYPGGFTEASVGDKYATVRLQEEQAPVELVEGEAQSHGLAPGYLFELQQHKDAAQNAEYLTTRAEYDFAVAPYEATSELEKNAELKTRPWTCKFTALQSSTYFRPARVTPRPTIPGLQTAKVVGPSSDEIYTDQHGRVKVHFHWDRESKLDENRSCWIRVAQMWAGPSWGSQHLPRVGNEVVVSFLEGDPDQPLITGSVYNGLNTPPFPLPAKKEVSGVKSRSTQNGGKGYNELSFDDTTGKELVNFHAQKDLKTVVENSEDATVKNKRFTKIGGDDTEVVIGTQNIDAGSQFVTVKKTYALRSLVSAEIACGASLIKLTPTGIVITAPKIDILAPGFQVFSAKAAIVPAVQTVPLPLPIPPLPPTPPVPAIPPPAIDATGISG
ncbi:MAG TPA: type VI secretion system tip protein TssI/VgrG [Polyangiaceae bacterium]|nr:type VI secretion system tip protein TssI/VgrG [Polyangiaceae bacterium]